MIEVLKSQLVWVKSVKQSALVRCFVIRDYDSSCSADLRPHNDRPYVAYTRAKNIDKVNFIQIVFSP